LLLCRSILGQDTAIALASLTPMSSADRPATMSAADAKSTGAGVRTGDAGTNRAIAERVGYGNEYAFSKAFRRELGVAPSRGRAESRA
jgi:AraC-like DNA-binding protein